MTALNPVSEAARGRLLTLACLLALLLVPSAAQAYPWMIRHGYNACASCHVDPSGGGILSPYGRAQAELLVATQYQERAPDQEVSKTTNFLMGMVPLPNFLNLGVSIRGGALYNQAGLTSTWRPVQMASDLRAAAEVGSLRASASVGYAIRRALPASITPWEENNLVSREHWLGVTSEDQSLLIRAGRINLPFGLRMPEHTLWVRERTRTDINEDQQHGIALSWGTEKVRTEVMGFIGNLQQHPYAFRERGYSGFAEVSLMPELAAGLSSLITQARLDADTRQDFMVRHSHGLFARWSPVHVLVLSAELDLLAYKPQGLKGQYGHAGLLQADYEVVQGLHLIASAETLNDRGIGGVGGWLSGAWFISHWAELRVDGIFRRLTSESGPSDVFTVISQLHLSF